jgi:hypothetical protein
MDNIKPWQIILFVAAIGVLGFSVWKFGFSSSVPVTDGYLTIDVKTGQLYDIKKGRAKGVSLPAKHPETGERTLFPVNLVDGMDYVIPSGYESFLSEEVREGSKLDPGKFTITASPADPIRHVLKP